MIYPALTYCLDQPELFIKSRERSFASLKANYTATPQEARAKSNKTKNPKLLSFPIESTSNQPQLRWLLYQSLLRPDFALTLTFLAAVLQISLKMV